MLIIDEIHFPPPRPPIKDIIGGAGTYSALGARLLQTPENAHLVSWTVHVGSNFPTQILDQITSWKTSVNLIDTKQRLTTRGWNHYRDDDFRDFRYLSPKIQVDHTHLTDAQLLSKCFHIISSPSRCIDLAKGILKARQTLIGHGKWRSRSSSNKMTEAFDRPIFVWEPVPPSCVPEELSNILAALEFVDVISPNHHELAALYHKEDQTSSLPSELESIELQVNNLLSSGFKNRAGTAVAVRRGERGCYVAWNREQTEDIGYMWYPAYHRPLGETCQDERETFTQKVLDPTGGGNAFLGGFCIGLLGETKIERANFQLGAIYGSVAASFAIEQLGMPSLSQAENGEDLWNEESVMDRIRKFRANLEKL